MEKVSILSYILITIMFLLAFFGNLSTNHVRRQRLITTYLISAFFFLIFSVIYMFRMGSFKTGLIPYNLFIGVGIVLPHLISRILVRQKISHPVIFLQKKRPSLTAILIGVTGFAYLAWVALSPRTYNITEGKPIYDEFYVFSSFSFLLFYIPLIILSVQFLIERTAICENGFYQGGLLSDWSNYKSYTWAQGEIYADPDIQPFLNKNTLVELTIEPKRKFFGTSIQIIVPLDEKPAIDNLLSRKINKAQSIGQRSSTQATTA